MAEGEHRESFWRGWSRWDKIVAAGLAMVLLAVTAEITVEYFEERREQRQERLQDQRTEAREREIRECVIEVVEGIRIYLNERGQIAERDRESVNRVIRTVAEARREGNTDPAAFNAALRHFEQVQRQVEQERKNSELSDFPTGDCVEHVEPLQEPEAVEPTEPTEPEEAEPNTTDGASMPREEKAPKKSGRRSPKPDRPDSPDRPEPQPTPPNPPIIDIDPPDLPQAPALPDLAVAVPGVLNVQVEPDAGIEVELLPEQEPACVR